MMSEFEELRSIMKRLRSECPWDREQDLSSLRRYLIEEAYECLESMNLYIENKNEATYLHLKEELGDVLLQVLFQAKLLEEESKTDALSELCRELKDKLIRRHPHIFEGSSTLSAEAVHQQWNKIKAAEKPKQSSLLGEVPKAMTALMRAQKIGNKTHKVKFDWETIDQVASQVESEWKELKNAKSEEEREEEFGDLMFSMVQWARHQGMDAETTLAKANQKFEGRFFEMERIAKASNQEFESLTLDEKEKLWQAAKLNLKKKA